MEYSFNVNNNYDNWVLKDFLRKNGVSAAAIRAVKFLPDGITVNCVKTNTNERIKTGDVVKVLSLENKSTDVEPQDIPLEIIYESENAMVLNKPAGIPVHPTRGHVNGTLANGFCGLMQKRGTPMPFRAINRIDKNTSGLVLLSLNSFSVPFLSKSAEKEYYAVVEGKMEQLNGTVDAPIARCNNSIITREVNENGKRAITDYEVLAFSDEVSLVCAKLRTGRTHQIRVHFSFLGHSLCGDDLYGGSLKKIKRHALHCGKLSFKEPLSNSVITCSAYFPSDMSQLLKSEDINYYL